MTPWATKRGYLLYPLRRCSMSSERSRFGCGIAPRIGLLALGPISENGGGGVPLAAGNHRHGLTEGCSNDRLFPSRPIFLELSLAGLEIDSQIRHGFNQTWLQCLCGNEVGRDGKTVSCDGARQPTGLGKSQLRSALALQPIVEWVFQSLPDTCVDFGSPGKTSMR